MQQPRLKKPADVLITVGDDLYISEPGMNDIPELVTYLNDRLIYSHTLRIPHPYTTRDGEWYINFCRERKKTFGRTMEWCIRNERMELIGGIGLQGLSSRETHKEVLGYWLGSPFRNRKIMSRAVSAFCDYVFSSYGIVRLEAHVYLNNKASCRILEKAGFEKEAVMKKFVCKDGQYIDSFLYARVI